MNKERFNEILGELLKRDESVETTSLLEELRQGYTENTNEAEIEGWKTKYNDLEKKYIDTFKNILNNEPEEQGAPAPQVVEKEINPASQMTFDDIFINE